jgi:hypothetical protein
MRRVAFVVMIIGMYILVLFIGFGVKEIEGYEDLLDLEVNQKVFLEGIIVSERIIYEGTKLFVFENGIELVCECLESFVGKRVEVEGVVEEYDGRKQVRVLEMSG